MKLKQLTIATLVALNAPLTLAASNAIPVGSNLGYGDASNNNTVFSSTANPAWLGGNLHMENNYGLGLTGGVAVKQNDFNQLVSEYNNSVKPILDGTSTDDALTRADQLTKEVTSLILDTRDTFYLQADVIGSLPLAISHSSFGGVGVEISGQSGLRARILSTDTPIYVDTSALNGSSTNEDILAASRVETAFYLKTAVMTEAALTYANSFYSNSDGHLVVGAKAKYMQAKLVKSVSNLKNYLDASINGTDIGDQLNDDLKAHQSLEDTENQFGVDIGAQWVSDNWMAGISLMNLNSPKFKYTLSTNSATAANNYKDQISFQESVELKPQARLEGSLFSEDRNWTLGASFDANETVDLMNNPYQWATISASYATDIGESWWYALVPDVRIGYRKNLVGDERNYITPGFTWGPLILDMGFESFEDLSKISNIGSTNDDNPDLPEAFMVNIGLEFYF